MTGKTRFRVSFLGKLVLQVEYAHNVCDRPDLGDPDWIVKNWRDATIEDLTTNDALSTINFIQGKQ